MRKPVFSRDLVHLIGFSGDIPTAIVCAKPVYYYANTYAIGNLDNMCVLVDRDAYWVNRLVERRSMTRLEQKSEFPIRMHEDVSVIVVSDSGFARLTAAIPGWEDRLTYQRVEGRSARWVALPVEEAGFYLGNLAHRMTLEMDRLLRTATGNGVIEQQVEMLGWLIWEGLAVSDEKHRKQILVRIVAAHRMRVDLPPSSLETLRMKAVKSIFLSVKDEVKRGGFALEDQRKKLDELVNRYIERLLSTSNEP